jgi:hypothetical protein
VANDGKFLNLTNGVPSQEAAIATSAGAGDANKMIKLDSGGKLDSTLMPSGVAPENRTMTTSEALSAGDLVNIHNSSGPKVRKADATAPGKEAHGFVLASASSGGTVTVYPEENVLSGLTGLTPGLPQFLSATAGARTETAPSTSGQVAQYVGFAISTTEMLFRPRHAYTLA